MPRRVFLSLLVLAALSVKSLPPAVHAQASFNYAEALQKAIFFYEAQIAGPKPAWSRVSWRGNSAMQDGQDVGRDLTGGWFDAGDHVKFGFAMASSATMLAWGGVEYRSAFEAKGQLPHLLNNLRFVNDYFIKAHSAPNELWGQVGNGGSDHSFWGSAEVMHLRTSRPSARITAACGGSDLAAETAAAMAASSLVFRPTDPAYANTLLAHARQLFAFAEATHPSFYVDCIPDAAGFYNSHFGNPNDEMAWAAIWLARATGEAAFLARARQLYPTMCKESGTSTPCFTWSQSWNDKHFGTYVLMAQATGEQPFHDDVRRWLDYWTQGAGATTRTTPGGLMFVHSFGPIRYATNAAFLALVYTDIIGSGDPDFTRYRNFARRQVDYALGLNPRSSSYVVGFGNNPPRNPHHRTAHGTWTNNPTGEPNPSRHTLYGGLVGGPTADDNWADERNNFERTEVATDFNAGLTGALARLAQLFGGNPLSNFPPLETPADEIFIDAQINVSGQNFTEIRAFLTNQSAWPSRVLSQGTFRYYFTLEPGLTPAQVTLNGNFNQCGSGNLSGPTQFAGNVYFVTVSCVGTNVYPGGQDVFRREVQFRIAVPANVPGNWDTSNDYSIQGLTSSAPTRTRRIVVFDGPNRIWGDEPNQTPGFALSATPASVSVGQGGAAASTIGITRSGGFTGGVTLSASGLPAGVTAAFSVNPATGASSLATFNAAANAATGMFPVTITGTAAGVPTQTTSIALTVTGSGGFTLSANPASVTVVRGSTATSTINVARTGTFAGAVTLSASGLPAGVTAAFSVNPATGANSIVTFTAAATATLGPATVTVTGTATGVPNQTTSISLTVNPAAGFTLSATPASVGVTRGSTATSTINVNRTGGFAGGVTLSTSGLPTGVTAAFSVNPATGASSVVTFTAAATATLGPATVTVTGAATGVPNQTTSISLTVNPVGGVVTITPLVNQNQPYFNEEAVRLDNTATLTALSVTVVIQRTTGVSFSGQYNTVGGQIQQSNSSTAAAITYQWTLGAGQTLGASTNRLFAAQAGGNGTPHPTAGDTWSVTYTAGGQTVTQSGTFGGGAGDFTLSPSPSNVSVVRGASGSTTLSVSRQNGFAAALSCSVSPLPPGVTAAFNPASVTGSSTILTFNASATATVGASSPTISCTGGGLTRTAPINLTVVAGPDFSVALSPPSLNVPPGTSATSMLNITRSGGFTASVSCSVTGLPTGATVTFSPTSTTANSMTATVSIPATVVPGTYTLTFSCLGGGLTRTTTLALTVPSGGFTVAPTPSTVGVNQGGSVSSTLTLTRAGGFTASVTCTASPLPTGVTASFAPTPIAGNTSTLTFAANATAATGTTTVTVNCSGGGQSASTSITLTVSPGGGTNAYTQRFLDMWNELHGVGGDNGYFHPANVPYHSVETLMVEAPDHGHETTSEAYSFWAWLEVMYGRTTGDWTPLQRMFDSMEAFIIPTAADQPTNSFYNPGDPADYAPEFDLPSGYPAPIDSGLDTGSDPIGAQLQSTYGTNDIYGMHWILDVDNFYGYGRRGDGVSQPSYVNTFQRGPQESTWETVPHPSWEDFLSGGSTAGGFLPLFITGPTPAQQWRYTNAPDADARLIQAMYWANQFAPANSTVAALSRKAARMGDYLRYAFFDKYFKTMGCASPQCPAGSGYNAAHYLLSWYYAWGGPIPPQGGWSFRIGSSHNHFGYQNPMAAHALTTVAALRPGNPSDPNNQSVIDWRTSLDRQLEFYRWLQSADGGIGGGATNSWGGRYLAPPAGTATFYGMFFQTNPVYLDPGSNTWFGFQVWSMERVAEYYHETNNAEAKIILDKWIPWAMTNTRLPADGTFQVPSTLAWSGQPSLNWNAATQNWNPADTAFNAGLRVTVTEWGTDLGVTAALAKTLIYYSAGTRRWATQHTASQAMAKELLDRMWALYRDDIGVSAEEERRDYNRFDDPIFVPGSFSGSMANGDPINSASTFLGIRSGYSSDPDFPQVQAYLAGGPAPRFRYHRFWAQADVALANAEYGRLFP